MLCFFLTICWGKVCYINDGLCCALQWQKKYGEFSRTVWGQAFTLGLVFFLLYTGIAFKLLNLLFILWWLAPFILVPMSKYLNRKVGHFARLPLTHSVIPRSSHKCLTVA